MATRLAAKNATAKSQEKWKYLSRRTDRKGPDLYVMGTRLPASNVWSSILVEGYTVEKAAQDWDIPVEAVRECVAFCEMHEEELSAEADRVWKEAEADGIILEPPRNP